MRTLMTVELDIKATNEARRDGRLDTVMQETLARLQPEAAYFAPTNGVRTCYFVFDLEGPQ